jgi:multiple sugar transport system permease protein
LRRTRVARLVLASLLAIVVLMFFLFPVAWILLTSFKTTVDADSPPFPISFRPVVGNYGQVLFSELVGSVPLFAHAALDSVLIASASSLIALSLALPAAYTLSRHKTKWNGRLGQWILSQRMAPAIFFIFPFYVMFYRLDLLDNFLSVILAHVSLNLPLAVWMLKSLTEDIPQELDESAKVDGCSDFGAFARVVLPLLRSGVAAAVILMFLLSWSELPFALILTGTHTETFPVYLSQFAPYHSVSWNLVAASTILGILPAIVMVFLVSKYLVRGLTLGGVKQ